MDPDDDHERWSELAAGHVLSALDDADEAAYLRHVAGCASCRALEKDLSETLTELATVPPLVVPPPSLKASIMRAVAEDETAAGNATVPTLDSRRRRRLPELLTAAAAAIVIIAGGLAWGLSGGHHHASVAARCAQAHCPTATLTANGSQIATVMVLDKTVYVQTSGLPATPAADSYVLWRLTDDGSAVGIAALHTTPGAKPVKAAILDVPISAVSAFALSQEPGDTVPAAPTDVLGAGKPRPQS